MDITSAKYTETGSILAIINGVEMSIPDDMSNRHRSALEDWEGVIEPFTPPPVDLYDYAANKRWKIENGGINVSGIAVSTDDRSKLMISGARIKADSDPSFTTQWKTSDGTFITLNASEIVNISDAVLLHVNTCFTFEGNVVTGITNGEITTTEQIDSLAIDMDLV